MLWLGLAITAPALYAATNVIDRFVVEKHVKDPIVLAAFGGAITFFLGTVIWFLAGLPLFSIGATAIILVAGALTELALIPYFKAIALDDASRVVPLYQIIPIFVLLFSFLVLGETLSKIQALGFCFILCGGFLLSLKDLKIASIFRLRRSFWYMMLASLMYAGSVVLFKFVSTTQSFWSTLSYEFLGGGMALLVLVVSSKYRSRIADDFSKIKGKIWGVLGLNEMLYVLARLTSFYAIFLGSVTLVSVLSGFQPFFVFAMGTLLSIKFPSMLQEDLRRSTIILKLIAITSIVAGVWFIG